MKQVTTALLLNQSYAFRNLNVGLQNSDLEFGWFIIYSVVLVRVPQRYYGTAGFCTYDLRL